ncbi:hypothetical protein RND81_08G002400 [Saponaria officinalis]|uniref:Transcription repressor n=1 Tax=Saponaria officinalis TaxID=3572 RepID=A0AAW1J287_SAPOF
MMKWGKKKKPSSSSTSTSSTSTNTLPAHLHLISHVLPRSWLSKFKQTTEKPVSKNNLNVMKKHNLEKSSPRVALSQRLRQSNYYKDEDGFWRLRFDEDNTGFSPKFALSKPSCVDCKTSAKQVATTTTAKKSRVVVKQGGGDNAKEEILQRTYDRIMAATEELHKELDDVDGFRKSVEKEVWRDLKDAKIRQIMSKNEQQQQQQQQQRRPQPQQQQEEQRKSFYVSREMKGRVRSPRTPLRTESCKIRAIEDIKRAKMIKKKAKEIEQVKYGSYAIVKRSCDPHHDFKESMVEMIMEKNIRRSEELEELLACYLTLNSEEYHDVIVKVFRQVWCDLQQQQQQQQSSYCM